MILSLKCHRFTCRENSKTHWELGINDMNEAKQLNARMLPVISLPSVPQTKLNARDKGGLGAKRSTWKITYPPSHFSSIVPRIWKDASEESPLFLGTCLCNLHFSPGESAVDGAEESAETQLELSCFSRILQFGDFLHLSSSDNSCPSSPTITSNHYLLFRDLPFLIIFLFSWSDSY